jgi:hypothetical protein
MSGKSMLPSSDQPSGLVNTAHFLGYDGTAPADIVLWYNALIAMLPQSPHLGAPPREI